MTDRITAIQRFCAIKDSFEGIQKVTIAPTPMSPQLPQDLTKRQQEGPGMTLDFVHHSSEPMLVTTTTSVQHNQHPTFDNDDTSSSTKNHTEGPMKHSPLKSGRGGLVSNAMKKICIEWSHMEWLDLIMIFTLGTKVGGITRIHSRQ